MLYANDGDWVESLTALVEHADGRLEIIDWTACGTPGALSATSSDPCPWPVGEAA